MSDMQIKQVNTVANKTFIVTPVAAVRLFIDEADREFFAAPVEVTLHHSDVSTRQLYVNSPIQGKTYPVNSKWLRKGHQLTIRQGERARMVEA